MRRASILRSIHYGVSMGRDRTCNMSLPLLNRTFSDKPSGEDDLNDRVMAQIASDPIFLRDIIKRVRLAGEKDPNIVEARKFLIDFIIQSDSNKDGVVTREEMTRWLKRSTEIDDNNVRYVSESEASSRECDTEPTLTQTRQHFIKVAIPFVGFGFLDNVIMIISGNEIESYFGVSLGISAMAAAGLGNTLSDIVGIQAGGMIEAMSDKLGIEDPDLTKRQLKSKTIRFLTLLASMLGITVGCLLGMFPLLFQDEKDDDKSLRAIFDSVDKDKSGKLELKELDVLFGLLCQGKYIESPHQAREFMRSCGFDERDSLNFAEFKQLFTAFVQKAELDKQAYKKKSSRELAVAAE